MIALQDPSLSTGVQLLELLSAVSPLTVNSSLITPGYSPKEKEMNAKYILSVARKLGATCYCTWEDIVDVKQKMILLLVAAVMQVAQRSVGK